MNDEPLTCQDITRAAIAMASYEAGQVLIRHASEMEERAAATERRLAEAKAEIERLREELRQQTNRADDLDGYGKAFDKLVRPVAEFCGFKKEALTHSEQATPEGAEAGEGD